MTRTYKDMGMIASKAKNNGAAFNYFSKALDALRKIYRGDHLDTAPTLYNLGVIAYQKGDYGKSLQYVNGSLMIRERLLGEDDPTVKTTKRYGCKNSPKDKKRI